MEVTFWENFCYHLAIDYDSFLLFFYNWFSVRGLSGNLTVKIPATPRVHVSVPLYHKNKSPLSPLSIDSDYSESSADEIEVNFEGSLTPDSLSSCENIKLKRLDSRSTPDIVRTIRDGHQEGVEMDIDLGFQSDNSLCATGGNTVQKLEQLQQQFDQMQRDIAGLVQLHRMTACHMGSISPATVFHPIMSSSPACNLTVPVPPPPCLPPPAPVAMTPIFSQIRVNKQESSQLVRLRRDAPDMSAMLQEMTTIKLRPVFTGDVAVSPINTDSSLSFVPRIPLRSVTRHESIIAVALRERFKQFRMESSSNESPSSSAHDTSDEWGANDSDDSAPTVVAKVDENRNNNNNYNNQGMSPIANAGRFLLRRVDRSMLPAVVSQDFKEDQE